MSRLFMAFLLAACGPGDGRQSTSDMVDAPTGEHIGALRRKGLRSILKDEWLLLDPNDREIGRIEEESMLMALIRRFITALIPQTYNGFIGDRSAVVFRQNFNPFVMKLTTDFSPDTGNLLDRRLGIAAGVLLCAIEGKQGDMG